MINYFDTSKSIFNVSEWCGHAVSRNYELSRLRYSADETPVWTRVCEQRSLKLKRQPHLAVSSFSLLKPSRMKCVIPSTKWGFANAVRAYISRMARIDSLGANEYQGCTPREDFNTHGNARLSRKLNSHVCNVLMMAPKVQRNENNILVTQWPMWLTSFVQWSSSWQKYLRCAQSAILGTKECILILFIPRYKFLAYLW